MRKWIFAVAVYSAFASQATAPCRAAAPTAPAAVDSQRLAGGAREPDQWFTPGRDPEGTYYSPLDAVNDGNVARLGFAWDYHLGTRRGLYFSECLSGDIVGCLFDRAAFVQVVVQRMGRPLLIIIEQHMDARRLNVGVD